MSRYASSRLCWLCLSLWLSSVFSVSCQGYDTYLNESDTPLEVNVKWYTLYTSAQTIKREHFKVIMSY